MPRAILFDVDGVLVHGYHSRPELQRPWDKNLERDLGVDADQFREKFIFDIFIKKVIIGEVALIDALERFLPSIGYHGSPMAFAHYWLTHDSQVNQELFELLVQLKSKVDGPLYIATNQEHMRAMWIWHELGMHKIFDDIFYSARLGERKPDAAYFKAIEQRVGPFSEPPLFFNDTPKVVEAGRKAGWEAVIFNSNEDFTHHPYIAECVG